MNSNYGRRRNAAGAKLLAPEYGGTGEIVGRCADVLPADIVLPAHWAPLTIPFYEGDMFPSRFKTVAEAVRHLVVEVGPGAAALDGLVAEARRRLRSKA